MTLIELIVVLWILAAVLAVSAPALSGFFRGRSLDEEARRMLALTRYARSAAASRAVPMELWIHPEDSAYGLRPQAGYEDDGANDVAADAAQTLEYTLAEGLSITVDDVANPSDSSYPSDRSNQSDNGGESIIRFMPDGELDDAGLTQMTIREDESGAERQIALDKTGLGYAIQ